VSARRHRVALALRLVLAAPLLGCGAEAPADSPAARDLIVLVLDALPAAALGCYGAESDCTPNIDALARDGLRFDQAYASGSYTLCSVASYFTGLDPEAHGVRNASANVLGQDHHTLAEALQAGGFRTAAFSCNPNVSAEGSFDQGFERFELYLRPSGGRHAVPQACLEEALDWWRAHRGERRFLYLHLLPPHAPYDPPEDSVAAQSARTRRGDGRLARLYELRDAGRALSEDDHDVQRIRECYDAGLAYADEEVGALLAELTEAGELEGTAIALLSDHGEAFAEHGEILHGTQVYTESLRVPLLLKWPSGPARAYEGLVALRDLPASLCELLGVPWSQAGAGGSFLGDVLAAREPEAPAIVSRSMQNSPGWSLRTQRWTLVQQADGRRELYDRGADPGERVDLAEREPELTRTLARQLVTLRERAHRIGRQRASGERSTAHQEELRAIGYSDGD